VLGAALPSWLAPIVTEIRNLGIPLGAVGIGIGFGALAFLTVDALRRRPTTDGAGTVPVTLVSSPDPDEDTAGLPPPRSVRVLDGEGEHTVLLRGAGESPAVPIPRARAFVVAFVALFATLSVALLLLYTSLFGRYDHLVALVGSVLYWPLPWPGVFAVGVTQLIVPDFIFPMYLAALLAFGFASGLFTGREGIPRHRTYLAVAVILAYIAAELVVDSLFFTVPGATLRGLALLVRTFTGGLFMAFLTFCAMFLPHPQRITARFRRDRRAIGVFFGVGFVAVALGTTTVLALAFALRFTTVLVAFTLVLLLPILALTYFATIARFVYGRGLRERPIPPVTVFHPSVSIVMPAYNEEEWIEEAIAHADRAAGHYPGSVEIVVGNDGSTDRTLSLAREAIARLEHARGRVVDLPHGGKSNALNGALAVATGEIVIRCDADTFISESPGFAAIIPHFADPEVGSVQGAVHPRQRTGWTRKLRALEIAWNHYFLRPAGMGTRSAEVIDGLFSAFRRADLVEIGGWVPWNGEDTEITMRLQRLGYRIRIEFGALAYEDVPENYDQLRKQRVRWARGVLMANGQHYPAALGPTPEFAGLGVLFWFTLVMRSGVRSLVYLFLALLVIILGVPALLDVLVLLALAIAVRAVPIGYFLARMGRWDILPWIPFFPFGNIMKQTFRFEAYGLLGPQALREYV
jgi:cellulose synthase/poly-beta-1,6-N-acetylglucosamine synthase-like glycosyltransferase